jgi:hypothetical protein
MESGSSADAIVIVMLWTSCPALDRMLGMRPHLGRAQMVRRRVENRTRSSCISALAGTDARRGGLCAVFLSTGGERAAKGHCGRTMLVCETGNHARPDRRRRIGDPRILIWGMGGASPSYFLPWLEEMHAKVRQWRQS